ncbi:MAG TPA: hypothetical protein VE591_00145 [Candidatus Acidoferrum sp.]|nr:hypothetical protein [Candidatus Acidoferrum sp.]
MKVFGWFNGARFNDLPLELRDALQVRANLRAVIILRQSDSDVKNIVFQRLNAGGISLNAQESRTGPPSIPAPRAARRQSEHMAARGVRAGDRSL